MTLVTSDRPEPGTIIGWLRNGTRPVYVQAGGSEDDDDDDTGIDLEGGGKAGGDEPEDDEGETADDAEQAKPAAAKPTEKQPTKDDITKLTGALEKERAASKAARVQARELAAQLKAATKKPSADETEASLETAREEAAAAAEQKLKPVVVNAAAKAALLSAGLSVSGDATAKNNTIKKLLRTLDLADIDIDDDGEVTGLEEQIDEIVEAFPELFKKDEPAPAQKVRAPRLDAAGKNNAQPVPKTTGERYAQQILGNTGR